MNTRWNSNALFQSENVHQVSFVHFISFAILLVSTFSTMIHSNNPYQELKSLEIAHKKLLRLKGKVSRREKREEAIERGKSPEESEWKLTISWIFDGKSIRHLVVAFFKEAKNFGAFMFADRRHRNEWRKTNRNNFSKLLLFRCHN